MNTALLLLLLCFYAAKDCANSQTTQDIRYQADPSFCCNTQPGPRVQVSTAELDEIANESPFYEVLATPSFYNQGLDNVCYTFFPMDGSTYLRMTSLTYSNGSLIIQKYIVERLTGFPGVGRIQGLALATGPSTLVFDEVFLGTPCPGVLVYYRKYIAGSCNVLQDEIQDGRDFRHGDSNTRGLSDYCSNQVVKLANSQSFNGSDFVKYPYELNCNCVTKLNGVSCVNADRVRPQDSISLPFPGSC